MVEQVEPLRIVGRRAKGPVLVVLAVLPFVYDYAAYVTGAYGVLGSVLILSVVVSVLMAAFLLIIACIRSPLERLDTAYERLRFYRLRLVAMLLLPGFANAFALPFLVGVVWGTLRPCPEQWAIAAVPVLWCLLIGFLVIVYRMIRPRLIDAEGRVVPEDAIAANVDPHWHWWGYYNPDDPKEVVEARYGIGIVPNLAQRGTWVVLGTFLAVIVLPPFVAIVIVALVESCAGR